MPIMTIKIRLIELGKTQRWLALELGISERQLSDTIHGLRSASPKMRKRIARALKTDETKLFVQAA